MGIYQLVGDWEPFSESVRKWLYDSWTGTKPRMVSQFGYDDQQNELTENDWKALMRDRADYISLRTGETRTLSSANHWAERATTIYIDIFSETKAADLALAIDEIIIANPVPTINKTNGEASAILGFFEYTPDWTAIQKDTNVGLVTQYAGEIDVIYQIDNS